uniref:Uncharacterized protein n=1 Tax=Timema cristinae TaxID=61476 RepID=A0A7R9GX29_TIMCR|nr:unnamed protein product [Timema cristinae]
MGVGHALPKSTHMHISRNKLNVECLPIPNFTNKIARIQTINVIYASNAKTEVVLNSFLYKKTSQLKCFDEIKPGQISPPPPPSNLSSPSEGWAATEFASVENSSTKSISTYNWDEGEGKDEFPELSNRVQSLFAEDKVSYAEILWAINHMTHSSVGSFSAFNEHFKEMFSDSDITQKFLMHKDSLDINNSLCLTQGISKSQSGWEDTDWEPSVDGSGASSRLEEARKKREEKKLLRQKELEARRATRITGGPMKLGAKKNHHILIYKHLLCKKRGVRTVSKIRFVLSMSLVSNKTCNKDGKGKDLTEKSGDEVCMKKAERETKEELGGADNSTCASGRRIIDKSKGFCLYMQKYKPSLSAKSAHIHTVGPCYCCDNMSDWCLQYDESIYSTQIWSSSTDPSRLDCRKL